MNVVSNKLTGFNSLLSLQPLVAVLKRMIVEKKPGARKLYENLLSEIEAQPELLKPIDDPAQLTRHTELAEALMGAIFPPATIDNEGLYAISYPFHTEIIYASPKFKEQFLKEGSNCIDVPERETNVSIARASLNLAYNLILKKFYALPVPTVASSVHHFTDAETGLTQYLELKLDAQFVEVKLADAGFALPTKLAQQRQLDIDELKELLPLEHFRFEGLVVIAVADMTQEQVIAEIKNTLLNLNASSDISLYADLQVHIETLIGLHKIEVGITPFFRMNDYQLFSETYFKNSLLFRHKKVALQTDKVSRLCRQLFRNSDQPLLYQVLNDQNSSHNSILQYYYDLGVRSLIICPLTRDDGDLIGLLEISSTQPGALHFQHLTKMKSALHLFSLALEKTNENLELQIDKIIKEHFTAIQAAVEWKFTEAAFEYLQHQQVNEAAKMPPIAFENVFPLYGAIDVRNSSVERNNAIQLDLLEQLNKARRVLQKASASLQFPMLKEIEYKVEKYITTASDVLLSDDEMRIYDFLQVDLDSLLKHLRETMPDLHKVIDEYFASIDPQRNILYHHRRLYEESITKINDILDRFIDAEQKTAQQVYPHYFERYVTDGIEFNIYVGQSLAPQHPFDDVYVKNLKLWQLTMLAKAARVTHALEKRLPMPLQTTQLILAHSIPLTISFRRKERKFDVDGAYNIRYEIIKKRIDKVHLKDSEERLTQPGKIAVVYSQQKELNEYMEYIEFLQHEGLLADNLEHLELEDTQGISGLKAVRVDVHLGNGNGDNHAKTETARPASKPALRK